MNSIKSDGNGGFDINVQMEVLKKYGIWGFIVLSLVGGSGFSGVKWALDEYHESRNMQEEVARIDSEQVRNFKEHQEMMKTIQSRLDAGAQSIGEIKTDVAVIRAKLEGN